MPAGGGKLALSLNKAILKECGFSQSGIRQESRSSG